MDKQSLYIHAIQDAYPDFSIEAVQLNQNGQFNDILIVNNESIFRFPKTQREAAKLVTETALLQRLQRYVTLHWITCLTPLTILSGKQYHAREYLFFEE